MVPMISLGIAILIILYLIIAYNSLVKLKNMAEEGWSGIDVQLKKRYNLIPNLVSTVKGYASHEKEVFENVSAMRSTGINAETVKQQANAENMLTQALGKLFAVAENYPDLRANQNFMELQNELSQIEKDIELARRYYNGTVRENNIKIESFPSNIVANMFSFKKFDFFEIDDQSIKTTPKVDFS